MGSAVGHTVGHAVSGMFGGGSSSRAEEAPAAPTYNSAPVASPNATACDIDQRAFLRCLEQNNNDIGACQIYYDMFKQVHE